MEDKLSLMERILIVSNDLVVGKEGRNTFSNYDYIRPDDLQNALRPLLLKYRIFYKFNVEKNNIGESSDNIATLSLYNLDDTNDSITYTMEVDDIVIKGASSIQSAGGLRTYCKRYLLMDAFFIADNSDDLDNNKEFSSIDSKLISTARKLASEKQKENPKAVKDAVFKATPTLKIQDIKDNKVLEALIETLKNIKGENL